MTRRLLAALVATLLGVATGAVVVSAPAQADVCRAGQGVTVVVDYQQLGGGTSTACVPGGSMIAASAFAAAGVDMQRAARQRGFVCRVNAQPTDAGCVQASPANAYWSLWVSSGNGTWSYATSGVDGVTVPEGGWVAWSWQDQADRAQPRVSPVGAPAAEPSTGTNQGKGSTDGGSSTSLGGSGSGDAASGGERLKAADDTKREKGEKDSDDAKGRKDAKDDAESEEAGAGRSEAPTAAPSDADGDARSASADAGSGSPVGTLAAVVVVLALLAAAGVVAWRRRSAAP